MIKKIIFSAVFVCLFSISAQGSFIVGDISFEGDLANLDPAGSNLLTATGISFGNGGVGVAEVTVAGTTGDYASAVGDDSDWADFAWNPSTAPVSPLWTTTPTDGGPVFSFALTSIGNVTQTQVGPLIFLIVEGTGIMSGTGFDDTDASFILTAQDAGGGNLTSVSFSASNASVPEPASIAVWSLIGLCGLGYAGAKRFRK